MAKSLSHTACWVNIKHAARGELGVAPGAGQLQQRVSNLAQTSKALMGCWMGKAEYKLVNYLINSIKELFVTRTYSHMI